MADVDYKAKLDELLKVNISDVTDLNSHYIAIAECYYKLHQYKNEYRYREMLSKMNPSATNWNNLAVSLMNQGIKKNVLNYFKKSIKLGTISSTIYSNFIIHITRNRLFATAKNTHPTSLNYKGSLEVIIKFADLCVDNNEIQAFALTNDLTICDGCQDYAENFIVKKIFEITNKVENKNAIRALLLSLYENVGEIKKRLKYSFKKYNRNVGHYTRIENLKQLIKADTDTKLHLYNVQYMNDPSEGNIFYELVESTSKKTIFNRKHEKGRTLINDSNTYLGSFSMNIDSLPLWVQYGNDGMGCCLVFEDDFFDENEPVTDPKLYGISASSGEEEQKEVTEKYVLYKVEYVDNIDKCSYKTQLHTIGDIMLRLYDESNTSGEYNEIISYAMNILDQVRFLFKGRDYEHERELRIIKWSNTPLCDDGLRSKEVPHLYIDMERELKFKEVILGPKVSKPSEIAPYLYYTRKVSTVTKSTIKYQ